MRRVVAIAVLLLAPGVVVADRAEDLGLEFVDVPAARQSSYPGLLGEIYARTYQPQRWGDKTTAAHEETHGTNSAIRNKHGTSDSCNAMYVGGNRGILIQEPRVSLNTVARYLPPAMREMSYDLYFRQSLRDWQYNTLYLCDEWSAYVNCTAVGAESGRVGYSDALQMAEFTVYVIAAACAVDGHKPDYDARQMRAAIAWMCEMRVMPLLAKPGAEAGAAHWRKFQTRRDCQALREFCRGWFGTAWCRSVFHF